MEGGRGGGREISLVESIHSQSLSSLKDHWFKIPYPLS